LGDCRAPTPFRAVTRPLNEPLPDPILLNIQFPFNHVLALVVASIPAGSAAAPAADWPGWRGPTRSGHAAATEDPPVRWSETENVVWRTPVPGRGHSSPTIAGVRIFLSTADESTGHQRVLCFDRATGRPIWDTVVHHGKIDPNLSRQSSHASPTIACDSERLYASFFTDGGIHLSALDLSGRLLWQQHVSDFVTVRGYGASPLFHDSLVIVNADHKGGGKLAAFEARTGVLRWEVARPALQNYPSPVVMWFGGRAELFVAGCNLVASFAPLTGKRYWEAAGSTETTVSTPVSDGRRIFITGGFPKSHVAAIAANGSGELLWQSNAGMYVPSLVVTEGHVFGVLDSGRAACWNAETGVELWRDKVNREVFSSPVVARGRIYVTGVDGVTTVLAADPRRLTVLAQNALGDEAYASPAIAGNRLFLRHAKKGEPRQEYLWCIGK